MAQPNISSLRGQLLGRSPLGDADRLSRAEKRVRQQFPGIGQLDFIVQPGTGPGFAEFYPPDEKFNPNPGKATIEIRRMDLPDDEIAATILGDALHLAPLVNPKFRKLKQQFVRSMKPAQLQIARDMYLEQKQRGDPRSFPQFVEQVVADAFIRDFIFQRTGSIPGGKPFVEGVGPVMGAFYPEQVPFLKAMEEFVRQQSVNGP